MNDKPEAIVDNTDEDDDEEDGYHSQYSYVTFNKDCCVRAVLATVVIVTAIVLVVIVASYKKEDHVTMTVAANKESVYWQPGSIHQRLVFEHQFLLRDQSDQRPLRILAIDDVRQMYVIVWPEINKHYNLYLTVNFEKSTETILVVSKSENSHGTNVEENMVLVCETKRFDRTFQGNFAGVLDVMANSSSEIKSSDEKLALVINYVGGPLTLERFISTVVNSSCDDLQAAVVFQWNKLDESLACGDRAHSEANLDSCSRDLCQTFPGVPVSRGQICHNFRSCNYVQRSCDPYYRHNPSRFDRHPYCVCRKTASQNAETVTCPRIADDGGECELPRRDLLVSHRTLPCLCLYRFQVVFPYKLKSERSINLQHESSYKGHTVVHWNMKETSVTGPALTFLQCSC